MTASDTFSILKTTKDTLPRVPFLALKNAVLGPKYELSLVFIGERRSRRLNRSYRDKDKPTDVLSFTLSKTEGEIFITPKVAARKAKEFDREFDNFIAFLFIHGMFHLKGFDHGSTMEKAEAKIRAQFKLD